jgi:predicted transcriptional regulator YheO
MPDRDPRRRIAPVFLPYLGLMDFLGEVVGPNCEIVLHDLADPAHSIIAIVHGDLTGRVLGGPTTDLALRILHQHQYDDQAYLVNYSSRSVNGLHMRSSTFFIRDETGAICGLLCFNSDDSSLLAVRDLIDQALGRSTSQTGSGSEGSHAPDEKSSPAPSVESFTRSVEDLVSDAIASAVQTRRIDPSRMTADERRAIVSDLNKAGVFLVKSSVPQAARALHISAPTLYRYLGQCKKDSGVGKA